MSCINLYGGPLKGDLEALYGFLQKSLGPQQLTRGYYFRYIKMDALFLEHFDELRSRMGRGIPRERFRPLLAQCLSFLREHHVIELLPVLQATDQGQTIRCADYVLIQQGISGALATEPFLERAIADSAEAAARFLGRNDPAAQAEISRRLAAGDPGFLEGFPYYRLRAAYRAPWHPPTDDSHGFFADLPRIKEQGCLLPVYARLVADGKLFFESRLEGIRKLGGKFPLAWPTAEPNPEQLFNLHAKMRAIFTSQVLGLGPAADGKAPAELNFQANTTQGFQSACRAHLESGSAVPSASVAHNLGVQTLQFARAVLLKPDDRLRPDLLFSRNLVIAMIMHTETVNRYEQRQASRQDEDRLKECVQAIARAMPPFVDLHALVRTKESQENNRKQLYEQILKHEQIRTADNLRKMTFGSERVVVAFHLLRLNDVFAFSARASREGDFSWHMMLERRFGTQEHPEKLKAQLRDEIYTGYLAIREAFFFSTLPWYRRLIHSLGFGKNPEPEDVSKAVREETAALDLAVQAIETKEQREEIKKKRDEMVRPRPAHQVEEPAHEDLPTTISGEAPTPAGSALRPPAQKTKQAPARAQSPSATAGAKAPAPPASHARPATPPRPSGDPTAAPGSRERAAPSPSLAPGSGNADARTAEAKPAHSRAADDTREVAGPAKSSVDGSRPTHAFSENEPIADEDLGSLLGVEVTEDLKKPRLSREELTQMTGELLSPPTTREIDDRVWEQALGSEARDETKRTVPQAKPKPRSQTTGKGWEQEILRAGSRVGVDLSERARLVRQDAAAARAAEKDKKKQERQRRAAEKSRQRQSAQVLRHMEAARSGGGAGSGTSRKHSVVVSVPFDLSVSGQPDEILFKKQFFKDPEFRKGMARFYEAEAGRAATPAEKKYYEFLKAAMEENHAQFL